MATPFACHSDAIIEVPPADGNVAAGSTAAGELQQTESAAGSTAAGNLQQTKTSAHDKVIWKQLKSLHNIVFYIELLQYLGNAVGTVAFLWATVVLLGGFCSLLSRLDFWFATIMVFLEGTRVFISNDASVNQWLFGSTRAFRWDHFFFANKNDYLNPIIAAVIGVGISLTPIEVGSQTITGILKVALLAITCRLLTRRPWGWFAKAVLLLLGLTSVCGTFYASYKSESHHGSSRAKLISLGVFYGWLVGTLAATVVTTLIMVCMVNKGVPILVLKAIVALTLVFLPLLHSKLGSKYKYFSISIASALLTVCIVDRAIELKKKDKGEEEQINALLLGTWKLLSKIVDTIMPILFFWGVMFPLPGIPLKESFYMLLSVIAAVLVGNMQIPMAFLQILLSSLRLHSLLGGHHSHRDYNPLPDGASPNLVPSIVVFFVLELCQGSSNILGVILGFFSFACRRSLVHVFGLRKEWVAKAVSLYYHQAFMTIKEKGLYPMEKSTPPSFDSFAIESLGSTSSEMQIVRLHVLDYYLQQEDSKSKRKLMAQIAKDAAGIVTKITGTISHLITDEEILSSGDDTDTDTLTQTIVVLKRLLNLKQTLKLELGLKKLKQKQKQKKKQRRKQKRSSLSLCLIFVWRLAVAGGKIGTRFRHELSGNPILLDSLQRILDMEDCPQELWEPVMDVLKLLALHDEATAKEIGSTDAVIPKLMGIFLDRGDVIHLRDDEDGSLRKAAGEVLANLTITSSDNCRTTLELEADTHDLIKNLISMLQDDKYINVAAKLLHNLCANSGDMLIDLDAKEELKSALETVLQIIIGNRNDKQLDAALCVASQIGYVVPKEDFARVLAENNLAPNTDTAAELVGKLVVTLESNSKPNSQYPRLRRFVIGTVISIMELCPGYIEIFRTKGAEDALNKLKGTPSRLEKHKVFVGDADEKEGMVPESTAMQELVDKAKRLIMVGGKSNHN